jgi:hypothetical protein
MKITIQIKNNRYYNEWLTSYGATLSTELKINDFCFYCNFDLKSKLRLVSIYSFKELSRIKYQYYFNQNLIL